MDSWTAYPVPVVTRCRPSPGTGIARGPESFYISLGGSTSEDGVVRKPWRSALHLPRSLHTARAWSRHPDSWVFTRASRPGVSVSCLCRSFELEGCFDSTALDEHTAEGKQHRCPWRLLGAPSAAVEFSEASCLPSQHLTAVILPLITVRSTHWPGAGKLQLEKNSSA